MMRNFNIVIICLFLCGCATQYDERLLGSWRSDREGTIAEYTRRFPIRFEGNTETKEKFKQIFGNLIHTFTLNDLTVEYEDNVFTVGYKVLKLEKDYVLIKTYGEDGEEIKIRFVDDLNSYWVNEDSDFPEKFTKINTEPQL
jgi:hypothetical protein